jgi:hypothetical protein
VLTHNFFKRILFAAQSPQWLEESVVLTHNIFKRILFAAQAPQGLEESVLC